MAVRQLLVKVALASHRVKPVLLIGRTGPMVTQPNTTLQSGKYRILRTSERHETKIIMDFFG